MQLLNQNLIQPTANSTPAYKPATNMPSMGVQAKSPEMTPTQTSNTLSGSQKAPTNSYIVKSGDNLSTIAKNAGMSLSDLLNYNPSYKANPNLVKAGASINLGGGTISQGGQTGTTPAYTPTNTGSQGQTGNTITPPQAPTSLSPVSPAETANATVGDTQGQGGVYQQLINQLAGFADKGQGAVQKARQDLLNFNNQLAAQYADIESRPIPLEFQQGRAQVLAKQAAYQQQNYQGALTNALEEQGQGINALTQAGNLAAPVQIAPGSTLSSPITGDQVAGGLGGYANYQTAQQVFNQASAYKDAVNSQGQPFVYNEQLTPQQNWQDFATNYLPNSRTYQASLVSSGLPSNIGGGGQQNPFALSTGIKTAQQGYQTSAQDYQNLLTQYQGAQALGGELVRVMSSGGINPSNLTDANQAVRVIRSRLSSPEQAKFNSTLSNVRATYAGILASGGGTIPTESTNALNTIIDENASLNAVMSAIDQLNREVYKGKVVPMYNQVQSYSQQLNQSGGAQSSAGGETAQIGGATYKKVNGKWVVA